MLLDEAKKRAPLSMPKCYIDGFTLTPGMKQLFDRGRRHVIRTKYVDFYDLHVGIFNWENSVRLRWWIQNFNHIYYGILQYGDNNEECSDFYSNLVDTRDRKCRCPATPCTALESHLSSVRTDVFSQTMSNQKTCRSRNRSH